MTGGAVARRYARALADVAEQTKVLERVRRELEAFAAVLREHGELSRFLQSPSVPAAAALQAVERLTGVMGFVDLTRRFLRLILQAGRLEVLEDILRAYGTLADERLGRLRAEVTAAVDLSEPVLGALRSRLTAVTGKQVYLTVKRDPSLIGGLVTRIGSQVYDGSLRAQLARLHEALIRA